MKSTKNLVSTSWLNNNLDSKKIKVLDASWYLPSAKRDPLREFREKHIPRSNFFDINLFSDPHNELPHMAPSALRFSSELAKLGVGDFHHIVVYDGAGLFSAARAWWLFRYFGVASVSILDGGLPKWISEGRSITSLIEDSPRFHISPKIDQALVCDWKDVKGLAASDPIQIVDARSPDRFLGKIPEPRAGLRSGHIPGSTNICYEELLNEDKTFKDLFLIRQIFEEKGVDLRKRIITSCGSGITAAILYLALDMIGATNVSLYDGSWSEWGARPDLALES